MGIFGNKDSIVGAALGVGGAFDKDRKTDSAVSPISSFDVNVEQGMCSITEDELSEKLGRS